jgi:hypothetical protein
MSDRLTPEAVRLRLPFNTCQPPYAIPARAITQVEGAAYRPVFIRQPPSLAGRDLSLKGAEVPLGFIEVGRVP